MCQPGAPSCDQEFQGNSGIGSYPGPTVLPGSALAYSAYAFPWEWVGSTFHDFYVPVAVVNTVLSTGLACYSRWEFRQQREFGMEGSGRDGRQGRGKREFFPLGNVESWMREMRDNGRSVNCGRFPRGFMECWEGLDREGTWG